MIFFLIRLLNTVRYTIFLHINNRTRLFVHGSIDFLDFFWFLLYNIIMYTSDDTEIT